MNSITLSILAPYLADSIGEDPTGSLLPWGAVPNTHGRVFVTYNLSDGAWWTTVHLDGVPVWRGTDARRWEWHHPKTGWLDFAAEKAAVAAVRAARREEAAAYAAALELATSLVAEGVALPYTPGQEGGFFTLPSGATLSARGLRARTLGVPRSTPWWGEEWDSWTASVQQGERGDQPRRLPRKAGWREVEAA